MTVLATFAVDVEDDVPIVRLEGEIDISNADDLGNAIANAVGASVRTMPMSPARVLAGVRKS